MTKIIMVTDRGTITLPKEIRQKLGVSKSGQIMVDYDTDGKVILRACTAMPIEIYSDARISEFEDAEKDLEPFMPKIRNMLSRAEAVKATKE